MPLRDLRDIRGPLVLPIYGKEYTIPPVSADLGAQLKLAEEGQPQPDLDKIYATPGGSFRVFLGAAYDEMVADDVHPDDIELALFTAHREFWRGRAAAEEMWEAGKLSPEFLAAVKAALTTMAEDSPATQPSPNTATAGKTHTRAGSKATTSRPGTRLPAAKKTPRASSGRRSSAN